MAWNVVCCAPVALSPEVWVKALPRLLPLSVYSEVKSEGSEPMVLNVVSSTFAMCCALVPSVEVKELSTALRPR
jgi:hypothetical protein